MIALALCLRQRPRRVQDTLPSYGRALVIGRVMMWSRLHVRILIYVCLYIRTRLRGNHVVEKTLNETTPCIPYSRSPKSFATGPIVPQHAF